MESLPPRFYVTGGSLPRDALCYVERRADADLLASLRRGEFCYVLTARQMGKSSLMVRTAARLSQEGTAVAILDPTAVGTNVTPEQWYDGLLVRLGDQLGLQQELESFWLAHERWGPLQRFMSAIQTVVLPALASLPPAPDVAAEKEDCLATAPAPPPAAGARN